MKLPKINVNYMTMADIVRNQQSSSADIFCKNIKEIYSKNNFTVKANIICPISLQLPVTESVLGCEPGARFFVLLLYDFLYFSVTEERVTREKDYGMLSCK